MNENETREQALNAERRIRQRRDTAEEIAETLRDEWVPDSPGGKQELERAIALFQTRADALDDSVDVLNEYVDL